MLKKTTVNVRRRSLVFCLGSAPVLVMSCRPYLYQNYLEEDLLNLEFIERLRIFALDDISVIGDILSRSKVSNTV